MNHKIAPYSYTVLYWLCQCCLHLEKHFSWASKGFARHSFTCWVSVEFDNCMPLSWDVMRVHFMWWLFAFLHCACVLSICPVATYFSSNFLCMCVWSLCYCNCVGNVRFAGILKLGLPSPFQAMSFFLNIT